MKAAGLLSNRFLACDRLFLDVSVYRHLEPGKGCAWRSGGRPLAQSQAGTPPLWMMVSTSTRPLPAPLRSVARRPFFDNPVACLFYLFQAAEAGGVCDSG